MTPLVKYFCAQNGNVYKASDVDPLIARLQTPKENVGTLMDYLREGDHAWLRCAERLDEERGKVEALTQRLTGIEEALKELIEACQKVDHHFLTRPIEKAQQALDGK